LKKGGAGKSNWGKATDTEDAAEIEPVADAPETTEPKEAPETPEGEKPASPDAKPEDQKPEQPAAPEEPAKDEKTLEEYRKAVEENLAKIALPKARQAGEGASDDWSQFAPIARDGDATSGYSLPKKQAGEKKKEAGDKKEAKVAQPKGEKVSVDKVLKVDAPRSSGGRGGASGGRGGRRGVQSNDRPHPSEPASRGPEDYPPLSKAAEPIKV
jgi:pyruvate/2-oxoglutarate dehydrogenase complex dihydrolipoamide acyltransferase (E2) component